MTPTQLRKALKTIGLSQREAAKRLYSDVGTVNRWAQGKHPIPGPVQSTIEAWVREAEAREAGLLDENREQPHAETIS